MPYDLEKALKSMVSGAPGLGWVIEVRTEDGHTFRQLNLRNLERGFQGLLPYHEARIDFWWWFDTTPAANRGIIRIYNLKKESIALFRKGDTITLRVDWQPNLMPPLVVTGTITKVDDFIEDQARVTRGTEIHFLDSPEYILTKITSRWWKPNTMYSMIFRDLCGDLGLPLRRMTPAKDFPARTGYSVMGNIWNEMQTVAANMESKLYCYNREVYLMPPDEGIPTQFIWSRLTGLFNIQKSVALSQDGRNKVFWQRFEPAHVHVTGLLVPILQPDSIVEIVDIPGSAAEAAHMALEHLLSGSPLTLGKFRVVHGCHSCDNSHMLTDVYLRQYGGAPPSVVLGDTQQAQNAPF